MLANRPALTSAGTTAAPFARPIPSTPPRGAETPCSFGFSRANPAEKAFGPGTNPGGGGSNPLSLWSVPGPAVPFQIIVDIAVAEGFSRNCSVRPVTGCPGRVRLRRRESGPGRT